MFDSVLSDKKSLRQFKNIGLSLFYKSGAVFFSFFLIPLFLKYLDTETYGIWLTMYSIVSWLSLLDGGLGNGLKNKLSSALARNELNEAKSYVSTTYFGLFFIMLTVSVVLIFTLPFVDYHSFFKAPKRISSQVDYSFIIVVVLFCIRLVIDLIQSILLAKQKSSIVNLLSFINNGAVFTLCYFLLPLLNDNKLVYISLILSITPILITSIISLIFYRGTFSDIKPSFKHYQSKHLKSLLNLGYKFFVIQIAVIIVFSTDNIIITRLLGPSQVTTYNIAFKLFSFFTLGWNIILMPYWTAFTESFEKGDIIWVKKTVKLLEKMWLLLAIITVGTLFLVDKLYFYWIGDSVKVPLNLSIAMASFVLVSTLTNIYVYVINSIGKLKVQFLSSILVGVINIPFSIVMVQNFGLGLSGVMFSTVACLCIGMILSYIQYQKIVNKTDLGIWSK